MVTGSIATSCLEDLLASRRPILADGAMATNLYRCGLVPGQAPEDWNETRPDQVRDLHRAFVAAGADILLTNTFGANACRLGAQADHVDRLNRLGAAHARAAAAASARPILVAGAVGPLGRSIGDAEAQAIFGAQMAALKSGAVDMIWIETMGSAREIRAAAAAAATSGLPYAITATFHCAGRTAEGLAPEDLTHLAAGLIPAPAAIGTNCGLGPDDMLAHLSALCRNAAMPVIAKPNAGLPVGEAGAFSYPATPDTFARFAVAAVRKGVRIVGGCCGATPDHLRAMRRAMHDMQAESGLP